MQTTLHYIFYGIAFRKNIAEFGICVGRRAKGRKMTPLKNVLGGYKQGNCMWTPRPFVYIEWWKEACLLELKERE